MKGLLIHWSDPWKDIYSGMDPQATALSHLITAFRLELHVIEMDWRFPPYMNSDNEQNGHELWPSMEAFIEAHPNDTICLADLHGTVTDAQLPSFDYVCLGPPEGWRGRHNVLDRWTYEPSPPGGFHALFCAHLIAHIGSRG